LPCVITLGKGFAECSTRQSPLGKILLGKEILPSAFYQDTRQNINIFCRVPQAALGKIFPAVTAPAINGYFAECSSKYSAKKIYFLSKKLCRVPPTQALGKFFYVF
jgi:hypothetical protein